MRDVDRTRGWHCTLAVVAATTAGMACDVPKHRAAVSPGTIAGVPYVDGDPLPTPPPRAALASAQWVVIATDDPALPSSVVKPTPAMLSHFIETHGGTIDVRTVTKLRRLAFGRVAPPPEAVEVDREALAELGFSPPAERVWLLGPDGPCHARVTTPMVGRYEGPGEVLELSWQLEGCPPAPWAPVGALTETLVPDLAWAPSRVVVDTGLDPAQSWGHPLRNWVDTPSWTGEPPTAHRVIVHDVPDAWPTPVTIWYGYLRSDPDAPDDPCRTTESLAATHGWWNGRALKRFDAVPKPHGWPRLLGALLQDEATEALVYADGLDLAIAIPPTPPPPAPENAPMETQDFEWGPDVWTRVALRTGHYARAQWDTARFTWTGCSS